MDGRVLLQGEQVSIEKSVYVSLCRKHWEEETGRWPVRDKRSSVPSIYGPGGKPEFSR